MKNLLAVSLLAASMTVQADEDKLFDGTVSIFGGVDTIHDKGDNYFELRYQDADAFQLTDNPAYHFGWATWVGSNDTLGLGLAYESENWSFGIGPQMHSAGEDVVETGWGYQILIEYKLFPQVYVGVSHVSNCRDVCTKLPLDFIPHGDEDDSNKGWNYVGLRWNFN